MPTAPVGMALSHDGRTLLVANSDRFERNAPGRLSCLRVDPASLAMTPGAEIATARFSREIKVLHYGATAAVTVGGRAIQMVPVEFGPC